MLVFGHSSVFIRKPEAYLFLFRYLAKAKCVPAPARHAVVESSCDAEVLTACYLEGSLNKQIYFLKSDTLLQATLGVSWF